MTPEPVWRKSSRCGNAACVEVAHLDGQWLVRDSKNPEPTWLYFDEAEWSEFVAGVKDGEFDVPGTTR